MSLIYIQSILDDNHASRNFRASCQKSRFSKVVLVYKSLRWLCYVLPIISLVKLFKETLICGGIDHGTSQRLRGTKSYAVNAQYRHVQCTIDIPTFLSPTSRKNAYAATAAVYLINACVVGISKRNKGKNPWFRTGDSGSLFQAAKYERSRNKHTRLQNINCYIFVWIVNRWSLTEIVAFLLIIKLLVNKSSVVSRIHSFQPPLFS